jgi:pilus assembly protein Flp/PilA
VQFTTLSACYLRDQSICLTPRLDVSLVAKYRRTLIPEERFLRTKVVLGQQVVCANVLLLSYLLQHASSEEPQMMHLLVNTIARLGRLGTSEEGQDLVEYALLLGLLAFGATSGMTSLASSVNHVLTTVGGTISSAVS